MKGWLVGAEAHWLVRMIFHTEFLNFLFLFYFILFIYFYIRVYLCTKHVLYFSMFPCLFVILASLLRPSSENVGQGERSTTSSGKSEEAKGKVVPLLVTNPFIP